jgi:hypothetical protein
MNLLTPLLDKAYSERRHDAAEFLRMKGDPLAYWSGFPRTGVSYKVTTLNSEPFVPSITVSINIPHRHREQLTFDVDGSGMYKVLNGSETQIGEILDSNLLYLLRTLYTAIAENERTMGEEAISIKIPRTRIEHNRDN